MKPVPPPSKTYIMRQDPSLVLLFLFSPPAASFLPFFPSHFHEVLQDWSLSTLDKQLVPSLGPAVTWEFRWSVPVLLLVMG